MKYFAHDLLENRLGCKYENIFCRVKELGMFL
jgi:hypothetical protein